MRVAALLLAACAAVSQAFVVPSSPASRIRGVMSMLKVRMCVCVVDRTKEAVQSFGKGVRGWCGV